MIAEQTERWTLDAVGKLKSWKFPGGYSAHDSAGDIYDFDTHAAWMAVNCGPRFFRHVKGAKGGQPLVPEPWQAAIYATLFGWKHRETGLRRYRVAYLEIPRGNGKSTMCVVVAGILLYIDDEPGADIFSAAGTRDQSKEVFGPFKLNVMGNPDLNGMSQCYQNSVTRIDPETGLPVGVYKAISADADFQHGGSPHGVIFDELHVQPNRDLWDVLQTGKIKRDQPLTVAITTAGWDRNSVCYEQRKYAESVIAGRSQDKTFLPVVYAASPEDDWTSPATWRKANPNLGVSIKESDLYDECEKAKSSPGYENTFKRLHLNIWTEQAVRWLAMDVWDKCNDPLPELAGEPCWCGLDLSSTIDLSAFAMAFRLDDGRYALKVHFWMPGDKMREKSLQDGVPYREWIDKGYITATPGSFIDHGAIRDQIVKWGDVYSIQEIAIDPHNAAQITVELREHHGFEAFPFRQGYLSMSPAAKDFQRAVLGKKILHGGNPVLRWNAINVTIQEDPAENIKPVKGKSTGRIDGIVAAVMAVGRAATANTSGCQGSLVVF